MSFGIDGATARPFGTYGVVPTDLINLYGTFTAASWVNISREYKSCTGVSLGPSGSLIFDNGTYFVHATIGARTTTNTSASCTFGWYINGNLSNKAAHSAAVEMRVANTSGTAVCRNSSMGAATVVTGPAQIFLNISGVSAATWNIEVFSLNIVVIRSL